VRWCAFRFHYRSCCNCGREAGNEPGLPRERARDSSSSIGRFRYKAAPIGPVLMSFRQPNCGAYARLCGGEILSLGTAAMTMTGAFVRSVGVANMAHVRLNRAFKLSLLCKTLDSMVRSGWSCAVTPRGGLIHQDAWRPGGFLPPNLRVKQLGRHSGEVELVSLLCISGRSR
jgi:hypothetical protein